MDAAQRTRHSESRTFATATASLNGARAFVTDFVRRAGGSDDLVARAELIASELISNAIEASPGPEYLVRMSQIDDGSLTVAVTNEPGGTRVPAPRHWHPDGVLAEKGRGLFIVTELADRVEVDQTEAATTVTAILER